MACRFSRVRVFAGKKRKWPVSEAHGVVRVRLLPWPSCLPDEQNHGLQAGTWTFQKHGFVTDLDPHGSKSGSEGIPWQLFSSRISWQAPNPAMMSKMEQNIEGFGSGFSDFSDFPQMENRDLGWIGLGLGSPKTVVSAKKPWFLDHFWQFPIIWGFPLGGPILAYVALCVDRDCGRALHLLHQALVLGRLHRSSGS